MPLCARCTSILAGYATLPLLLLFYSSVPLYLGLMMQIPMLIDGITQTLKWRESTNPLRVVTGLLSGVGQSIVVVSFVMQIVSVLR